jgi:hypothetical protein
LNNETPRFILAGPAVDEGIAIRQNPELGAVHVTASMQALLKPNAFDFAPEEAPGRKLAASFGLQSGRLLRANKPSMVFVEGKAIKYMIRPVLQGWTAQYRVPMRAPFPSSLWGVRGLWRLFLHLELIGNVTDTRDAHCTNHFHRARNIKRCQTTPRQCPPFEARHFRAGVKYNAGNRITTAKAALTENFNLSPDSNSRFSPEIPNHKSARNVAHKIIANTKVDRCR